jgi:predicted house-cleaning NTP pyrophosphatase (Maf/HAM1 superfamily)
MSATMTQATITIGLTDLEDLIHRTVQEAVREELVRLLRTPDRSILEYWEHEGPEDPAGDEELLAEALAMIQQYEENPEGWKTLEEFEAELAEAAHELPG